MKRAVIALVALLLSLPPVLAQPAPATILLVGANGMIGSRILAEAAARGHHVLAASREPDKIAKGANIQPIKLDAAGAQHGDRVLILGQRKQQMFKRSIFVPALIGTG